MDDVFRVLFWPGERIPTLIGLLFGMPAEDLAFKSDKDCQAAISRSDHRDCNKKILARKNA